MMTNPLLTAEQKERIEERLEAHAIMDMTNPEVIAASAQFRKHDRQLIAQFEQLLNTEGTDLKNRLEEFS